MRSDPIVVIDDHPEHLDYLATLLRRSGYRVEAFTSAKAALRYVETSPARLVISDVFMPDMDGFEVLKSLRGGARATPLIAVSGGRSNDRGLFLKAIRQLGAAAGFAKPIDGQSLLMTVDRLLRPDEPPAPSRPEPAPEITPP
jgi:CheY-like chemotaxis protein